MAEVKYIELTRGQWAIVDADDYGWLMQTSWHCLRHGYACRGTHPGKTHYMHREIMKALPGQIVDHINGNKLDNRKENLRIADKSLNAINAVKHRGSKTPYKGVTCNTACSTYTARYKRRYLGSFKTAEEAARAYDAAAIAEYGNTVIINFPAKIVDIV